MSVERLPVVGVLGSGSVEHSERARALGRWLAGQGVHLLTGGHVDAGDLLFVVKPLPAA